MKKKLIGLMLAVTTAVSMTACTGGTDAPATGDGNGTEDGFSCDSKAPPRIRRAGPFRQPDEIESGCRGCRRLLSTEKRTPPFLMMSFP